MRYDKIRLRGLGPFRDLVEVDLASIPGPLVAVTGENGAGKSTLLELMAGALYRSCPTRGSVRELALGRDSFVEVDVVNGARWTVRQTFDAIASKGASLILDEAGTPVLDDGKVSSADAWVRAHLPASEVLFSTMFAAQASAGFLDLKPAERKTVLNRLLGIEHLEVLAAAARERVRAAREEHVRVCVRLEGCGSVEDARAASELLGERRVEYASAAEFVDAARGALESARLADADLDGLRALERRAAELTRSRDAVHEVLGQADQIRGAVAAVGELERAREEAAAAASAAELEEERASGELARLRAEWGGAKNRGLAASERASALRARLAARPEVEAAQRAVLAAWCDVDEAVAADAALRGELKGLQSAQVAGLDDRILVLRACLHAIVEGRGVDAAPLAGAVLAEDDRAARAAEERPRRLRELELAQRAGSRESSRLRAQANVYETTARRAPELDRLDGEIATLEREREAAVAEGQRLHAAGSALVPKERAAKVAAEAARERLRRARCELEELRPLAARAGELEAAERRGLELDDELSGVVGEVAERRTVVEGHGTWSTAAAQAQLQAAEQALLDARAALTRAEGAYEHASSAAERARELEAQREGVEAQLADWNALAADLGRDGLQALLIDAAGPELTEICNDLLHRACGSRWTLVVETTRLASDGHRQLESLDIRVIDTEAGRDALVESYSGGERVILGEALSLALTTLACRRSGLTDITLVRDESGAALDPERSRQWVAMVRRAAELVGASQVLLVSHAEEVQELCDSKIVITNGRVEVQS